MANVSQGTISNILKRVSIAFAKQVKNYVKFPIDQKQNVDKLQEITGFPRLAGCVDGIHIKVGTTRGTLPEAFLNRMEFYSLNVQVIGGPNLEILDIVARNPGSIPDSSVFSRSSVRSRFQDCELMGVLIGDNAYVTTPYLLTPILDPSKFNIHGHS